MNIDTLLVVAKEIGYATAEKTYRAHLVEKQKEVDDLGARVAELEVFNTELVEYVMDMVAQDCRMPDGYYSDKAMQPYEDIFELLMRLERMERVENVKNERYRLLWPEGE